MRNEVFPKSFVLLFYGTRLPFKVESEQKFTGALSTAENSHMIMSLFIISGRINGLQFHPPLGYVASSEWFGTSLSHSCVYLDVST